MGNGRKILSVPAQSSNISVQLRTRTINLKTSFKVTKGGYLGIRPATTNRAMTIPIRLSPAMRPELTETV